jgi:hypothetical protein
MTVMRAFAVNCSLPMTNLPLALRCVMLLWQ